MNLGPNETTETPKETLKCQECGELHLRRNHPLLNESNKVVHNLQEASAIGEIGKSFHEIKEAFEDRQENHPYVIVEIEGIISNKIISILIDLGATLCYITPRMLEKCQLGKVRHSKP